MVRLYISQRKTRIFVWVLTSDKVYLQSAFYKGVSQIILSGFKTVVFCNNALFAS